MKVKTLIDDTLFRLGDPEAKIFFREAVRRAMNRVYRQLNLQLRVIQSEVTFDPAVNPLNTTQILTITTDKLLNDGTTDRAIVVQMDNVDIVDDSYAGATAADDFVTDLRAALALLAYVVVTTDDDVDYYRTIVTYNDYPYTTHILAAEETQVDVLVPKLYAAVETVPYNVPIYFDLPSDWHIPYRMDPLFEFLYPTVFGTKDELRSGNFHRNRTFSIENSRIYLNGAEKEGFTPVIMGYWTIGKELVENVTDVTTQVDEPEYREDLHDILFYGTCIQLSVDYPGAQMDAGTFVQRRADLSKYAKVLQDVHPVIQPWIRQGRGFKTRYGQDQYSYTKPYYLDD